VEAALRAIRRTLLAPSDTAGDAGTVTLAAGAGAGAGSGVAVAVPVPTAPAPRGRSSFLHRRSAFALRAGASVRASSAPAVASASSATPLAAVLGAPALGKDIVDGHQAHTMDLLWALHDRDRGRRIDHAQLAAATSRVAAAHPAAAALLAAADAAPPPSSTTPDCVRLLRWVQAVAAARGVRVWDAATGLADGR
jgi:hypothetical protein